MSIPTHAEPARFLALVCLLGAGATARAHFPILIHDAELGATNGPVTLTYALGHPFELEFEPAERPERMRVFDAQGRATDVTAGLRPTLFRHDTNGAAWEVRFDPRRGDGVVAVDSAATVDPAQATLYREYVKCFIHRAGPGGWATRTGQPLEIVPLTRPYGLRAGMVFCGRLLRGREPVPDIEVYAERLNDFRPAVKDLPPEPLVTFSARTDADGRFVLSLPDPGWWVLGGYVDDLGPVSQAGKQYRHEGFAGLWVRVEAP